jgi:hypothetical protein
VWQRSNGLRGVIQGAGYDAAGPQLRDLAIPASGVVGQVLVFGVSPFDVWSLPGATSWTFGDGATAPAPDAQVSHTFVRPGTFNVGVTASDALGNVSSATRSVAISAPAVPAARVRRLRVSRRSAATARAGCARASSPCPGASRAAADPRAPIASRSPDAWGVARWASARTGCRPPRARGGSSGAAARARLRIVP